MRISLEAGAFAPTRAHPEDAGLDLCVPRVDETRELCLCIPAHGRAIIDTGVHVEIPSGCVGFLKSKSGLMLKCGITTDGTIDEGYTGTIQVVVFNHSSVPASLRSGDKVTQLVIQEVVKPSIEIVERLEPAAGSRGEGGFGSTGKSVVSGEHL